MSDFQGVFTKYQYQHEEKRVIHNLAVDHSVKRFIGSTLSPQTAKIRVADYDKELSIIKVNNISELPLFPLGFKISLVLVFKNAQRAYYLISDKTLCSKIETLRDLAIKNKLVEATMLKGMVLSVEDNNGVYELNSGCS